MLRAIREEMKEKIEEIYPGLPEGLTVEEVMTLAIVERVISKGDAYAYASIMDSAYGKSTGEGEEEPIQVLDTTKYTLDELRAARNLIHKGRATGTAE